MHRFPHVEDGGGSVLSRRLRRYLEVGTELSFLQKHHAIFDSRQISNAQKMTSIASCNYVAIS